MPSKQEDLRRKLTWLTAFRIVATSLSLVAIVLRLVDESPAEPTRGDWTAFSIIGFVYLLSLVTAVAVRRGRWTGPAVVIQVLGDLVIATVLVVLTGGGESPFTFTYSLAVISGAILMERRGALALAAAGSLIYAGVVLGAHAGLAGLSVPPTRQATFLLGSHVLAMFLVAVLAGYLSRQLSAAGGALSAREKDLQRLETLQAQILAAMPSGLVTCDAEGRVTFVNRAASAILGIEMEAGRRRMLEDLLPGALHLGRRTSRRELTVRTPAGERILGLSTTPLADEREDALLIVFQDLTELRRMEDGLRRADRLAALGTMSAQLAHEIRNPLAAIVQANALLDEELQDPGQRQLTRMVQNNAQRLSKIVDEVLDVARVPEPGRTEPPSLVLDSSVQDICADWSQRAPRRRRIQLALATQGLPVDFDSEHLRRVLVNLLDNALRHASARPAAIQVSTRLSPEQQSSLQVWSDGAPLEDSVERHLFEPFFSSESRSSGLGLYICRELCERHRASIGYQRAVRQLGGASVPGNEFFVQFRPPKPAASSHPSSPATPTH